MSNAISAVILLNMAPRHVYLLYSFTDGIACDSYSRATGCQTRSSMAQFRVFASANAEETEARRRSSWFCS